MDIEIVAKKENELLERTEVTFKAVHEKEGTPERDAVREKLSAVLKAPKDRIVVDSMTSEFGRMDTLGYAKVYKSKDAAMKYEREHILVRNRLKEKAKAEKKPAEKAEKPKEEADKPEEPAKSADTPPKPE